MTTTDRWYTDNAIVNIVHNVGSVDSVYIDYIVDRGCRSLRCTLVEHIIDKVHCLNLCLINDSCIDLSNLDATLTEQLAHYIEVSTKRKPHGCSSVT